MTTALSTNRAVQEERSHYIKRKPISNPDDYGVDKLHLSFPVWPPEFRSSRWSLKSYGPPNERVITSGWIEIGNDRCKLRIDVYRPNGHEWWCALQFNPARVVNPSGIALCRPRDLERVIDGATIKVRRHVVPKIGSHLFQVRRVDIGRTFREVSSPGRYLAGLHSVPKPRARFNSLIRGKDGVVETLRAGSKSGGCVSLYDKHRESSGLAPPGTLRCEVQARPSWCQRYGGIFVVEDLTGMNIGRLFRNRVRWFGLERHVMTGRTACEQILRSKDLDIRTREGLALYVLAIERGVEPGVTSRTATKYRGILRELAIAPIPGSSVDTVVSRLDFKSGTEIRVA